MEFNSLLESLRSITKGKKILTIKEGDENNSSYEGSTATEPADIHSAVCKISHEWDTYKLDPSFPDNVKAALDGAIGQVNPGNGDAAKIATDALKTDQATQKTELAGDVKSTSDQNKFVPKVGEAKVEEKLLGKTNDQTKKAPAVAAKELKKDQETEKKEMAGDKKGLKDIAKETKPGVGKSKVK